MNKFKLKKQLKKESETHTPDILDRIKICANEHGYLKDSGASSVSGAVENGKSKTKRTKKWFAGFACSFAAVLLCLAIVLPVTLREPADTPVIFTSQDVYGMGAVSTVKLLGANTSAKAISAFSSAVGSVNTLKTDVKSQVDRFNAYFTAFDSFLGDDVISTVAERNTDAAYSYETKMTIKGLNFDGTTDSYVMYYTETLAEDDFDGDESEREYRLCGVMTLDDSVYYLEGERKEETDGKETENELKIRAYPNADDKSTYIEMEQKNSREHNESEAEYVYGVYVEDNLVEEVSVKFETERKGTKETAEYEMEFLSGTAEGKYKIKRKEKNGEIEFEAEYEFGGEKGKFEIKRSAEGGYIYQFENGDFIVM